MNAPPTNPPVSARQAPLQRYNLQQASILVVEDQEDI
jgi:hypothetical protein